MHLDESLKKEKFCTIINLIFRYKSTFVSDVVVHFRRKNFYNLITNLKEVQTMNTDKILAEAIAKDYAPKKSSKIVALKKLDNKAKLPATIFTYTFGIISSLVAGTGLCLSMQVIGSGFVGMFFGILIGIIGFTGCAVNYPIYKKILAKGKEKYAFEIIELAKEISEE